MVGVGVCRGVLISNCDFVVPHAPTGAEHIRVDNDSEVVIIGGRVVDGAGTHYFPDVSDDVYPGLPARGSRRIALLNWAGRIRLPRVTTEERTGGLGPPWRAGDLVYDVTAGRPFLYGSPSSGWQQL